MSWIDVSVFVCLFDFVEAHAKLEASMKDWDEPSRTAPRGRDVTFTGTPCGWQKEAPCGISYVTEMVESFGRDQDFAFLDESGFQKFKDLR